MKEFFKDYAEAMKAGTDFYKKHWLGSIIFSLTVGLATFAPIYIVSKVQEKKYENKIQRIYGPNPED